MVCGVRLDDVEQHVGGGERVLLAGQHVRGEVVEPRVGADVPEPLPQLVHGDRLDLASGTGQPTTTQVAGGLLVGPVPVDLGDDVVDPLVA